MITFLSKDKAIKSFQTNDDDYLAGMAAMAIPIAKIVNETRDPDFNIKITDLKGNNKSLKDYRVMNSVPSDLLPVCYNTNQLCLYMESFLKGKKGIWVNSGSPRGFCYSLYVFQKEYFLDGMHHLATTFNLNFMDFIYDAPFDSEGYIDSRYKFQKGIIYALLPDDLETDLEEAGDEEIQNPWGAYDRIEYDLDYSPFESNHFY